MKPTVEGNPRCHFNTVPDFLIPITSRDVGGNYLAGKLMIPKDWTVCKLDGNKIRKDGHLDYFKK